MTSGIEQGALLTVELESFGFKYGNKYGDMVFDARFLPNPYYIDALRPLTGKDKACADFVFSFSIAQKALVLLKELICMQAEGFQEHGRKSIKVCVGCTGGQHRSVALVEALAGEIEAAGFPVSVNHHDSSRWP